MNPRTKEWEKLLSGKRQQTEFNFFQWADIFMHEYGMSWNDFIKLKVPTFWLLCKALNKRYEQQEKAINKRKR